MRELAGVAAELGLAAVASRTSPTGSGCRRSRCSARRGRSSARCASARTSHTLVAASAGNHGRAVAHVAALRGLRCRVFLPARSAAARREAIAGEGAEVVVVDGSYEDAVAQAGAAAGRARARSRSPTSATSGPARWVIDGYATLFAEAAAQAVYDVILVPVGVGSLAAAAARFGAAGRRAR